jgi:hypothetical protein
MKVEVVATDGYHAIFGGAPRPTAPVAAIRFDGILRRSGSHAKSDEIVRAVGPMPTDGESDDVALTPHIE